MFLFYAITHFSRPFGRQHLNIKLLKAHWHFDLRVLILALSPSDLLCLCVLLLTLFSRHQLLSCYHNTKTRPNIQHGTMEKEMQSFSTSSFSVIYPCTWIEGVSQAE